MERYEKLPREKETKEYIKDLTIGFKFIIQSKRLKSLLLMLGLLWGIISLAGSYDVILLKRLDISATKIGIIIAILGIVKGIFSKYANSFNKIWKNKTLTKLGIILATSFIIAGLTIINFINFELKVILAIIAYSMLRATEGIYQIVKPRYLGNFTNSQILPKIYSANSVVTNLSRMVIELIGSLILGIVNIQYAMLILGILFIGLVILMYKYMKARVRTKTRRVQKRGYRVYCSKIVMQNIINK